MFRTVLQVDNFSIASLILSELEGAGFRPAPVSESAHVHLAGADQEYRVDVLDEERDAIIEFLVEHGHEKHVVGT